MTSLHCSLQRSWTLSVSDTVLLLLLLPRSLLLTSTMTCHGHCACRTCVFHNSLFLPGKSRRMHCGQVYGWHLYKTSVAGKVESKSRGEDEIKYVEAIAMRDFFRSSPSNHWLIKVQSIVIIIVLDSPSS